MATGARKYTLAADGKTLLVEASIPLTKAEAGMREYEAKTGKRKGDIRHISVLNDAGWSEDTGLRWNGYPIRAKVSFTVDLDGARVTRVGGMSVEEYEARKAAATPAASISTAKTNGPRPSASA